MKKIIFIPLLLFFANFGFSQNESIPISVSYFAPFGIQIGAKIGTSIPLKNQITLNPQIGYFWEYRSNRSFLLNADFQRKFRKEGKSFYQTPSVGLGYLIDGKIESVGVNLGSGELEFNQTNQHLFLPTVGYEFGWHLNEKLATGLKIFYGRQMSFQSTDAGFFGFEVVFNYQILKK